ncbi:tRNA-modifying protein YgfZ [Pantoea sp. Aalb]|uniref:tRNA-modifying protein YgfZ n=1 Tax=Pantoea sp. Aalb TaxID=2576762 RepID=UPI00132A50A8|nr:tRNA-modifying protein YgfZ [Pantoea sp. Aalb]MXP67736.1 tRNA-modifying protein YgfZ [Pantoea sp. Aalb]
MSIFPICNKSILDSSCLPLTLISLDEWVLVSVYGEDSTSYLQRQLTLNMNNINKKKHYLAAHCNSQGKMWSSLRLFYHNKGYTYIVRRTVHEKQTTELKKYIVCSKVKIIIDRDSILLGLAGFDARIALSSLFNTLPDKINSVVECNDSTLLWFPYPTERFLIITTLIQAQKLKEKLDNKIQFSNSNQWVALDIEAGIPIIDNVTSSKLIPQAANLQFLNAISFKKGCYIGQETVARTQFRGMNKRALYWLAGKANKIPNASSSIKLKIGDKWITTGIVLSSVQLNNNIIWVQVVMNKDINLNSILGIEGDQNSELTIQKLPYSLKE